MNKDVLNKFIDSLALKPLNKERYIDCCLKSIMNWEDNKYWKQINFNSQKLLNMAESELYQRYHIRNSSNNSNTIYNKIYKITNPKEKGIIGDDYHGYSLYAALNYKTEEEIKKKELTDEYFKDYRISHIWGCTKNIYLNNLPFNFFAIPSFCYCLSDKNNGGEIGKNFRFKLKCRVITKCGNSIALYNKKMIEKAADIKNILNNYKKDLAKIKSKEGKKDSEKDFFSQRINFILDQFILIPTFVSKKDVKVDKNKWNSWIENGLRIFIYENDEIKFNKEYIKYKSIFKKIN